MFANRSWLSLFSVLPTLCPLVDYGLRYRQGKSIGTASTEGLANTLVNRRMNKLQQMRWSAAGAHAVVVVRAHHINAANATSSTLANAA